MKTIKNYFLFAAVLLLVGTSCKKDWNGVRGTGAIITENRPLSGFTGVDYHLDGRVNIVHDSAFYVLVITYANYQPLIHLHVENGKLIVDSYKSLHDDEITLEIHMPVLESMYMAGSGRMYTSGIFSNVSLVAQKSGSGSKMTISGSGEIHAYGMPCESNEATISGSGTIETTTNISLTGTISGSGTIRYRGTPTVTSHISGSGHIVHQN